MQAEFWHDRWHNNEIGFHEAEPNPLLVRFLPDLDLQPGQRIFVPLCGKTRDIGWLLGRGFRVCGIELSALAVDQLFHDLGCSPAVEELGALRRCSADGLDVFVGDVFDLSREVLGPVDASFDRAALVALPDGMRRRYAAHLTAITNAARQLLVCFEYDQSAMDGPPFAVPAAEVIALYGPHYGLMQLARIDLPGGLKGKCAATEVVWKLQAE